MCIRDRRDNVIDLGKLEFCVREDLNKVAERRMAVLNPLKVVITNSVSYTHLDVYKRQIWTCEYFSILQSEQPPHLRIPVFS